MKELYSITKENMQALQDKGYMQPELEALKNLKPGLVPAILIKADIGFSSWYIKCIGEVFALHKIMIAEKWLLSGGREKYINFIVKSRDKGTKTGYTPLGGNPLGKGFDLVHQEAGLLIGLELNPASGIGSDTK